MSNETPADSGPTQFANDNGPLSRGQVKALKVAIGIMSFLIVAALVAIVGRVIYAASVGNGDGPPPPSALIHAKPSLALPAGAAVKSMTLSGDRLLVHYDAATGAGAMILDLATGKTLSHITMTQGIGTQATGTPVSGTPVSGTQASGTQASGTQASGTQAIGTRKP